MKLRKATQNQLRQKNRRLLLHAIYSGLANSRSDLAQETGLAKPTVGEVIGELIEDGLLIETGVGSSTWEGGKPPRLLEFVRNARHVIGLSVSAERINGVLTNLDGRVLVEHYKILNGEMGPKVLEAVYQVVNGLMAQLTAPLMCIGVGVSGTVAAQTGMVISAPHVGWQDLQLADLLKSRFTVPVYVANGTELAALAQYAFGETGTGNRVNRLVSVFVNDSIGVGLVLEGTVYHGGSEIGQMRLDPKGEPLEQLLSWTHFIHQARPIESRYVGQFLQKQSLSYLHLQQAIQENDPTGLKLQDEIAEYLAPIFAWAIVLLRPDHISLTGNITDIGPTLLEAALEHTRHLITPGLVDGVTFSLNNASNLIALGAVAKTLQQELGVV